MSDAALLPLRAQVEANRDQIKALVARHKGRAVAVFGSVARGEERQDSDVDFLVEFEPRSCLFDLADLEDALASLLGRRVDVVSLGGLRARDRRIRRDAQWLRRDQAETSLSRSERERLDDMREQCARIGRLVA